MGTRVVGRGDVERAVLGLEAVEGRDRRVGEALGLGEVPAAAAVITRTPTVGRRHEEAEEKEKR